MLPARCRMPPCMNIDVRTVTQVAGWSVDRPAGREPGWPSQAICPVDRDAVLAEVRELVRDRAVVDDARVATGP